MKKFANFMILIILLFNLTACKTTDSSPVSLTNFYFDTAVTITIYNCVDQQSATDIINGCFDLCKEYEALFSRTMKDSDISKINTSNGKPTKVHSAVSEIINDSLKYSQLSEGAFDITIAPLTSLWDIKNNPGTIPDANAIKSALKHINYNNISVNGDLVTLSDSDTQIDLGGIAKGYMANQLKNYLVSKGISSAIIDLGGNILTIGGKTTKDDFKIGIKKPFSDGSSEYAATISITDKSVVTSGIYERYFEKGNRIYHHILDTKTGYPVENNLYSVTIVSDSSESGDALSTGTFALGLDQGKQLINSIDNTEAIFITNQNKIILTDGLKMNENNEISFVGK